MMSIWPTSNLAFAAAPRPSEPNPDYGEWTNYQIPDDRSGWHPLVRRFYDYWLSVAPPGRLPGRQHISPDQMTPFLSKLWLLDIHRDPLRFRCRLIGSDMVRTLGGEVTGRWLDEVHPQSTVNPSSRERFRILAEQARPSWRRGLPHWVRAVPEYRVVESCLVPLAGDGVTVDIVMAMSMLFDGSGRQL